MQPNFKSRAVAGLVVMVLVGSCNCGSTKAEDPEPMSIKLDLERKSNESLRVVFRITVAQQFRIYTADLPWMTPPDLTFIVMPLYGGEGLRRVYILNSPVTGMTLLRPGETYEGSIDLVNFFPDVLKANSKE